MSIQSLLATEPVNQVLVPTQPGQTDDAGLPRGGLKRNGLTTQGRVQDMDARQTTMWLSLGVEANYSYTTFDDLLNGWFLWTPDQRLFQITGLRKWTYPKGNIPGFFSGGYPLKEITTGDRLLFAP